MSKDPFKDFVESNRQEFELHNQDFQELWVNIEQGLDTKSGSGSKKWWRIAAAVLVLALSGWVAVSYRIGDQMPYELQEAEQHYYRLISVKMEQLTPHQNSIDQLIWEDLETLDREYEELKKDLKERADQEEVAQAMVENQRVKLNILDQILSEIESKTEQEDVENLEI